MTLRLLHTGDWHLGHVFHGVERLHEHRCFVDWLLQTAAEKQVDAILVAGDVFDAANPPTSAVGLWYDFLARARDARHLQVVVIGGNHDSAARLDSLDPLLRRMGRLHVLGGAPRRDGQLDSERLVVPLKNASGETAALIAAVPFLRPADIGVPLGGDAYVDGIRRAIGGAVQAARALRQPGQALVAMAHLHLAGGQVSDLSERRLTIGDQEALPADIFPDDLAYVALGHLHRAQEVGRRAIRYTGSVIPLAFPERHYRHEVALVELDGERFVSAERLPVPRTVELMSIPEGGPGKLSRVVQELSALPPRSDGPEALRPYLEVQVELDEPQPDLRRLLEEALAGREARLVRIAPPKRAGDGESLADAGVATIADLQPEAVFRLKYERDYKLQPSDELVASFHELLDLVKQREEA
jgi:exonuclease SbcD